MSEGFFGGSSKRLNWRGESYKYDDEGKPHTGGESFRRALEAFHQAHIEGPWAQIIHYNA